MELRIVDFFCGAGGFSEGFRQQGFKIVMGIEKWKPAVDTHNINFNLNDHPKDILDFEDNIEHIEEFVPDTEVILGSPPCVSFSLANRGGKSNKDLGIRLIETFLKVVAVKKFKKDSILKAWFMENVPNSKNFVKEHYTFNDLGLGSWAKKNNLNPKNIAIKVKESGGILCSADYGSPQTRSRFVCGEFIENGEFLWPTITHQRQETPEVNLHDYVLLRDLKNKMPLPNRKHKTGVFVDPNYPSVSLNTEELTDHFYDTGVYKMEWEKAREAKLNHPFMGRMSFPENELKPSRTIMATRSASTREALLYKSEYDRKGNGEYRAPTIREAATIMGFPYVYQFAGSEGTKWRLIGNAVCPHLSSALAKALRKALKLQIIPTNRINFKSMEENYKLINNLNSFEENALNSPPKRTKGLKFRRHTFKDGNMTVGLTNYHPEENSKDAVGKKWFTSVYLGTGINYKSIIIDKQGLKTAKKIIEKELEYGKLFIKEFDNNFSKYIGRYDLLQEMYEINKGKENLLEPTKLVKEVGRFIRKYSPIGERHKFDNDAFIPKEDIPHCQLLTVYALGKISVE